MTPTSRQWVRPTFGLLLVGTAVLWTVGLSRNGWANAFYSAAVQAGSQSWKAMLFGSSDAAGSITVDKPPAALWPMEVSARVFGLNPWSILLPQVVLGIASVALLYVIVARGFGSAAGLLAGGVLASTPVATLMFRFNNPDALLVFLMVAAVWAVLRAVDDGRTRWLVLCGVLLGFGFLTKQLQVLLVVPGMALTYLIAGPPRLLTRFLQLLAGLVAMVVAAGWWVAVVELWPKDSRPYIGGSTNNSFLDLTFGYNGLGRLTGHEGAMFPTAGTGGPSGGPGPGGFGSPSGITRMFSGESGGQISWLLPAALILLVVGMVLCGRRTRTDPQRAQYVVWGGWLLVTAIVFSFMSGIFHDYYTVALAPAVAALVGAGVVSLWRLRENAWATTSLAALSAVTAAWAWILLGRTPDFVPWLRWAVLVTGVAAALLLAVAALRPTVGLRAWAAGLAVVAASAGPLAYCIETVSGERSGPIVTAGPSLPGRAMFPGGAAPSDPHGPGGSISGGPGPMMGVSDVPDEVAGILEDDAASYTWVAAVQGSAAAANYQLAVGDPVMPLGGFLSADPAPTLKQFQDRVVDGRVHYYIVSHQPSFVPPGLDDSSEASRIRDWVESTYTEFTVDGITLYDLTKPLT